MIFLSISKIFQNLLFLEIFQKYILKFGGSYFWRQIEYYTLLHIKYTCIHVYMCMHVCVQIDRESTSKWHLVGCADLGHPRWTECVNAEFLEADESILSQNTVEHASRVPPASPNEPAPRIRKASYPDTTWVVGAARRGHRPFVCWTCYSQAFSFHTFSCSSNKHQRPAFLGAKRVSAATLCK